MGNENKVPEHVAIILDGNGRWAKKRFLPRNVGHAQGAKAVEQICEDAWDLGIKYLTVYAFSTENWKRPEDEVAALMKLLKKYLSNCLERSSKNNMRVRVIGDIGRLSQDLQDQIIELEKKSSVNTGLNFTVALNYGGRDEMIRAMKNMYKEIEKGTCSVDDITEEKFASYLDTKGIPDPDLMIRTSGEQRISNYMLWQMAYAEFYFTDVLWPDFNKKELEKAIAYYAQRDRRYGGIK
ncbi:isoprenyl transferase [Clostridium sp. CAG:411]|jgi:undecaprenyl diphosphate synthase|nr:isoprenyl transferase [Lachnospiraceae bacterium]CDE42973.1 isoprenyl transferase [Clostridium sp. CAG:411]